MIRRERGGDEDGVRSVLIGAFGADGTHVADLADDLRANARLSLVAEQHGEIIGSVMLSRCWLDAAPRLVEVLVLSPLGVHEHHQRAGIGSQLVHRALAEATALQEPLVFLEGDPRYYRRFGFQNAGGLGFEAPSDRIPPVAFQVAVLPGHETWMTGALVYCDAFWRHDAAGPRE